MLRLALAAGLLATTCGVDAFAGRLQTTPISVELALGNPAATGVFVLLGALLVYFAQHCWRIRWRFLSLLAVVLVCMIPAIAFTDPASRIHMMLFVVFILLGITWLIAYAESDCQRSIAVLVILIVLSTFAITFILGVADAAGHRHAYEHWPLGLFQRGFLIAFGALALRRPNQLAEQN